MSTTATPVNVARVLAPVTVLGPGRRVALWVQGCGLACEGCSALDTWDPADGTAWPVDALVDALDGAIAADDLDCLTLTGGEPTDQAEALTSVVAELRARRTGLDVLLFTGRSLAAARAVAPELVAAATCVVAGPYRPQLATPAHRLVATANQELLVDQAASAGYDAWLADAAGPRLQVMAEGGALYLVGMPGPGDLDRFRERMADRGVIVEGVSW